MNFGLHTLGITRHGVSGIRLINSSVANNGDTFNGTVTSPSTNTTGANFLVAIVQYYTDGSVSVNDNKSNTWNSPGVPSVQTGVNSQMFYSYNATTGTGHTITATTPDVARIVFLAFSTVQSDSDPLESGSFSSTTADSNTINPYKGAPFSPLSAGDLVVTGWGAGAITDASWAIDSGFTLVSGAGPDDTFGGLAAAYLVAPDTTALDPQWSGTWDGSPGSGASSICMFAKA